MPHDDPPEYQPEENTYPALWADYHLGPHRNCGGWTIDSRDGIPVCACGTWLPTGEKVPA